MTSNIKNYKHAVLLMLGFLCVTMSLAQADYEKWKLQFAVGVNNPIDPNDPDRLYYSKLVNFPTLNIGVQHMFSSSLGAKLDFGYNKSVNHKNSLPYKLNYWRVNAQFVYDFYDMLTFLPPQINLVAHVGPGISISQPLNPYTQNKYTYANLLTGLELHYGISETFSVYGDISYVFGLSSADKYDEALDGFSFNHDFMYATIGVSIALSGCQYCY